MERLSPQQKACLRLVYARRSGGQIATELGISKSTVESHLAAARRVIGAKSSVEAAIAFNDYETSKGSCDPTTYPAPLPAPPDLPPASAPGQSPWWRVALPVRASGSFANDLTIRHRLIAGVLVSAVLAIGFGSIANAIHVISDIVRRLHSSR